MRHPALRLNPSLQKDRVPPRPLLWEKRTPPPLTERLEDVGGGLVDVVGVRLVALGVVLHPLALLLVAGLAAVASPPVVALGNVHADVHSVVTCQEEATGRVGGGGTEGAAGQITLETGNYINPKGH